MVTHHAPHPLCLPESQRTGWAAGNAASDLSYSIDTGQIALWVHGHLHHTVDLTRPSGTRILCNPAGPGFANPAFSDDWIVEVQPETVMDTTNFIMLMTASQPGGLPAVPLTAGQFAVHALLCIVGAAAGALITYCGWWLLLDRKPPPPGTRP